MGFDVVGPTGQCNADQGSGPFGGKHTMTLQIKDQYLDRQGGAAWQNLGVQRAQATKYGFKSAGTDGGRVIGVNQELRVWQLDRRFGSTGVHTKATVFRKRRLPESLSD